MAQNKTALFDQKQKKIAELAKAMGHPARIAILEILSRHNTCICGDISEELPLAQSTVSQHLKVLKEAGLIRGEIEGVRTCYCLEKEAIEMLDNVFTEYIKTLKSKLENCC